MADNFVRNVVQWVTDTASISKSVSEANRFGTATTAAAKRTADEFTNARAITAQYDDVLGRLGATASANLTLLEQSMRDGVRETERLRQTTDSTATEYNELAQSADRAAVSVKKAATAGGSGVNVGQIAGRTAGLGAVLGGEAGGAAFPVLAQVIQLGATFGPAGVAVGALAAASRLLTADAQKTTDALKKQSAAFLELQISLPNTSRAELQTQLDADQAALATAEAFARSASANVAKYIQANPEFTFPVTGIVSEALAGMGGTLGGLQGTADGANDRVRDLQDGIANLLITIAGLPEETEDLAAAEARLAASRQASADILQASLTYADAFVQGSALTTDQRQQEIASLQQQKDSYEALIATGRLNVNEIQALNDKLDQLDNQMAGLEDASSKYADQLAREQSAKDALTERNDQYLDAVDREVAAREKAFDIQNQINETTADRDAKLLDLQGDYFDRRDELTSDANERSLEAVAVAEERRQKIIRDAGRSFNEAIGARDADAYRQANLRAKDALEDNQATVEKQQEAVTKGLNKQLAALDKGYDKQVQSTVAAANKQISIQMRAYAEQQFLAQQAATSQAFLTANGMNSVVNTTQNGWSIIQNTFAQGFSNIAAAARAQMGGGSSSFPTLTASIGPATPSAQFNRQWDARFNQTASAARGGRTLIP